MFEDLFAYPKVVARHRDGPKASKRLRYLKHLADQRAARETLLRTARELLVIAQRLDLSGDRCVRQAEIDAAAQSWARYQHMRNRACGRSGHGVCSMTSPQRGFAFLASLTNRLPTSRRLIVKRSTNSSPINMMSVACLRSPTSASAGSSARIYARHSRPRLSRCFATPSRPSPPSRRPRPAWRGRD